MWDKTSAPPTSTKRNYSAEIDRMNLVGRAGFSTSIDYNSFSIQMVQL